MDSIEKALKDDTKDVRITNIYRWLVWSAGQSTYFVFEKRPYARHTTTLYRTDDFDEALDALLKDEA